MNGMFCKRCGVGKISKHYGVGHGSVPCRPLFHPPNRLQFYCHLVIDAPLQVDSMIAKQGLVWMCRMCGKSADTDKGREHLRLVHVKTHLVALDHACNLCGVLFKSRTRVMSHIAMAHTVSPESTAPYF